MIIKNNDLFVFAMEKEAKTFFDNLEFTQRIKDNFYKVKYKKAYFYILFSGIGVINTLYNLVNILDKYKINNIYNIGFVGGSGFKRGEIVEVYKSYFQDFDLTKFGYKIFQMPGCDDYITSDSLNLFKKSNLYTSSKFQEKRLEDVKSYVADMEGFAILYAAKKKDKKCYVIKIVTDEIQASNQFMQYKKAENLDSEYIYEKIIKELFKCVG